MDIINEKKKWYLPPEVAVTEVGWEGVICASGGPYPIWEGEPI